MVIEDVNPSCEMRRVVIPFGEQGEMTEQLTAQPSSLPLVPLIQERAMVGRAEPTLERTKLERTLALVTEAENEFAISEPKTVQPSTSMPYPSTTITSHSYYCNIPNFC